MERDEFATPDRRVCTKRPMKRGRWTSATAESRDRHNEADLTGGSLSFFFVTLSLMLSLKIGHAHEPPEEDEILMQEVVVADTPLKADQPPSPSAASERMITEQEIVLQPQTGRPGNLLRLVPGLITLNPSGGPGKGDNFLVRGFDADHGTDLAGFLDGMPLNLRSHAHGQGYLDLNFLIPETIKEIQVHKGPYQTQYGDFNTAAAANFVTRDIVDQDVATATGGQFNTQRYLVMLSPTKGRVRTLVAAEGFYTDGPFINANRYPRFNGLLKLTTNPTARSELSVTGTQYIGRWNASGEIPLREVNAGRLNRFGSLDPSQGGRTQRSTVHLRYHYDTPFGGNAFAETYLQYYRLNMFSNFTFFLNDPTNGDGIEQDDRRFLYGGELGYRQSGELFGMTASATIAAQARIDDAHVRLANQRQRVLLSTTVNSSIHEASYSPYLKLEFQPASWMRFVGGARADMFTFNVGDRCDASCAQHTSGKTAAMVTTTKGNLILGPWFGTEFFLNGGTGFHSNDARAVVSNPTIQPLARATGYEIGLRTRQWDRIELLLALWTLDLSSELVFNGDDATTEILGATRRYGVELGNRVRLLEWLTFTGDVTFTHAAFRSTGAAIPQAPLMTGRADVTATFGGLAASVQMLHLGSRWLTEDRSVSAQPFTIFNLVARYRPLTKGPWRNLEGYLSVQNLTDTQWRQTQLFYESQLATESRPMGDIHFVPGTPRMVIAGVSWYF